MVINHLPPQSTQRLGLPTGFHSSPMTGTGILTSCPSPTPFGLGLGPTNPTRTNLPSETLDVRRTCFSHVFRYSCQHSHFRSLQRSLPDRLLRSQNAPLPIAFQHSQASVSSLAPLHYPRSRVRPVSCYALFEGWLLLSQPPGCFNTTTSFST
jgi:hypothetical protein